jgi:hypothetical protein
MTDFRLFFISKSGFLRSACAPAVAASTVCIIGYCVLFDCSRLTRSVDGVPQSSAHPERRNRQLPVFQQPRASGRQGMPRALACVRVCVCVRACAVVGETPVRLYIRGAVDRAALPNSRECLRTRLRDDLVATPGGGAVLERR